MQDSTSDFSNWRFDFSRLTLAQRQIGPSISQITDGEIMQACRACRQLFNSLDYPVRDNRYFLIGFTDEYRFLLVDLSVGDDVLIIHDIALVDEFQVQELYCGWPTS